MEESQNSEPVSLSPGERNSIVCDFSCLNLLRVNALDVRDFFR